MTLRLSEEEYAELMRRRDFNTMGTPETLPDKKRTKYGNRITVVDGKKFGSQHEADYYFSVLWPRWMAGELVLLARQVPFDLPGGIRYIADFVTVDTEGRVEVIDAKSAITKKNRTYINKKKQMRAVWRIDILEV
jgi:hypothetical protein